MAENRNMYGGHDVSGYVPPTSNALPSENPDQAPDLNMEYLVKVSSILDRMEKMEAFIARDDERRKTYEEQRTADINALGIIARDITEVKNKIWEAGSYTNDMLKDFSELKNQGIGLTASAKETLQNVGTPSGRKWKNIWKGILSGRWMLTWMD